MLAIIHDAIDVRPHAKNRLDQCGLTNTVPPDDSDGLPWNYLQVHVVKNVAVLPPGVQTGHAQGVVTGNQGTPPSPGDPHELPVRDRW